MLHDLSGTAVINTAAVTGATTLDLHAGALSTIAGRNLQIATDTVVKFAWAGDGDDTILANDFGDIIQAGRGNDVIIAGAATDLLYGGPGGDKFVFNAFATSTDTIGDFVLGSDVIDLYKVFASLDYNGLDPVLDHWLNLTVDGSGGTVFMIDPHNGQAPVAMVDVIGVMPTNLQAGIDYWVTAHV